VGFESVEMLLPSTVHVLLVC